MLRYRLIYYAVFIAAISFYAAYSPWFSWYLLVLVVLLLPLDLLISLPGMLSKSVTISAPGLLKKNESGVLVVTAVHNKRFPVRCLVARLRVTGDDFVTRCRVLCPVGDISRGEVTIDTSHTGLTVFEIERLYAVSLMGVFSLKVKAEGRADVLILPPPRKPDSNMELPRSLALKPKPGGGYSEEHDMRKYRPGDSVKNIHWKLSAKFDSLIIREPLIPPPQSRLIHIVHWESPEQRDRALSHLLWAADYLISRGLTFYVKLGDRQPVEEIAEEDELLDFLRRVLDKTAILIPDHYPRMTRFSWVYKISGG